MKKLLFASALVLFSTVLKAQTEEELKAQITPKKDSIAAIQGGLMPCRPSWTLFPVGRSVLSEPLAGVFPASTTGFPREFPTTIQEPLVLRSMHLPINKKKKFFWRNAMNINLNWVKLDDKDDPNDEDGFRESTDVFNISSLYGFKLNDKFAVSTLGEYRTTILSNFNDPGYLDIGVGGTWTPITDLVVVIHPLNYNFVFSDEDTIFNSSLGAKIVADYTKQIGAVSFKSNLSMFQSYESGDLSNWTWTNSFAYTL